MGGFFLQTTGQKCCKIVEFYRQTYYNWMTYSFTWRQWMVQKCCKIVKIVVRFYRQFWINHGGMWQSALLADDNGTKLFAKLSKLLNFIANDLSLYIYGTVGASCSRLCKNIAKLCKCCKILNIYGEWDSFSFWQKTLVDFFGQILVEKVSNEKYIELSTNMPVCLVVFFS